MADKSIEQPKTFPNLMRGLSITERLWPRVEKTDYCWNWTGGVDTAGYGLISFNGRVQKTHRVTYQICKGTIPNDLCVLHRCDNRRCVRPGHLFLGTHLANYQDSVTKGRRVHPHGTATGRAALTDETVRDMRQLHRDGANFTQIGKRFGVHKSTARMAVTGRSWKHVT